MNHASAVSYLRDPRLAAYATSLDPVWVWSTDGTHVLWANAAAVALLGAPNLTQLRARKFNAHDRTTAHVIRLATSLPQNGAARLERLRGFGTGFFRLLTCTCSRLTLADGSSTILIAANEQAGSDLSFAERARLLLDGSDDALAAFGTDGTLLYATSAATHRMAGATTLIAFDANALAAEALVSGASAGRTLVGPTSIVRAGQHGSAMLIASFAAPPNVAHETTTAAPTIASPPVAPAPTPAPAVVPAAPAEPVPEAPAAAAPVSEPVAEPVQTEPVVPVEPAKPAPAVAAPRADEPPRPLRFVWQMDAQERFTLSSDDFLALTGPGVARHVGKPWNEVNAALKLDADGRVARAIATRDTWSGIILAWPVDGATQRLKVELSGLPIYDRQRTFIGYRGFGVCRDLEALTTIAAQRRAAPVAVAPAPVVEAPAARPPAAVEPSQPPAPQAPSAPTRPLETERQVITFIGPAQNVVPFRVVTPPPEPKAAPGLNAGERNTFTEIARQLSARLKSNERPAVAPHDNTATALRAAPAPGIDGRLPPDEPVDTPVAKPIEREEAPEREAAPAMAPAAANDSAPRGDTPGWLAQGSDARALLDRLPLGVLVYRFETMLYANRTFLECVGYDSLPAFSEAGGIDSLFIEASGGSSDAGTQTLTITTGKGDQVPVEGRLFSVPWNGESALALVLVGPKTQYDEPVAKPAPAPQHDDSELRARLQSIEAELAAAKRQLETSGNDRTDLLGKIGREVRTPLTAIIGFVETMLNERHGPIGNERYRTFLTDMHYSGSRILALFDDLASLTKIDRKTDTAGPGINLNDIVQGCVTQMQVEASRVRVLIRTSLGNPLPGVAAEQDSVRQVVLNLLTNSIRFAGPGGQVIVSTAKDGEGRVLLRLRDTGPGLSDNDLAALRSNSKPSASADAADQQLTLAVARALLEANHANLSVTSKTGEGTLVEAVFVAAR